MPITHVVSERGLNFKDDAGRVAKQVSVRGETQLTITSAFNPSGERRELVTNSSNWNGPRPLDFGHDSLGR